MNGEQTKFFIAPAPFGGELTSRAQAKYIAVKFENFNEVELDFAAVDYVGQGFADELARVWPLAHPGTRIKIINASESVIRMFKHVMGRSDLPHLVDVIKIESPDKKETDYAI